MRKLQVSSSPSTAGAIAVLATLALLAVPRGALAQSAVIYGQLGNFDISNDTGQTCHGFEMRSTASRPGPIAPELQAAPARRSSMRRHW
jgi:hypothetical protein